MTDFSAETQHLVDAGGWDDESYYGCEEHLHLRRRFGDQQQSIFVPFGTSLEDRFTLSQTRAADFLSEPETEDFPTLEAALLRAEVWRREKRVETDPRRTAKYVAAMASNAT